MRIAAGLFEQVRAHVEDFSRGEEAGFLICSGSRVETGHILLAREWPPIPGAEIARYAGGSAAEAPKSRFIVGGEVGMPAERVAVARTARRARL